uniref:ABC transporter D family member 1 n=1 Tax=Rhizophora mucronata TaxID=61149 RepID=A0A2P2MZB3_RHIMU
MANSFDSTSIKELFEEQRILHGLSLVKQKYRCRSANNS